MTQRDRTVLGVVAAIAAIAAAWFLFIAPKRDEASRLGTQITAAQGQLRVEQGIVAAGEAARRQYAGYSAELARLDTAVPADDDVPALIVQLQRAASRSGVDFRSLQLQSTGTSAPPPSTAAGSAAASAQAASAHAAAAAGTLPPGVTIGPAGLPQEPFTFAFTGSFFRLADFLGRVQRFVVARNDSVAVSGRLMTLNAVALSAGPAGFPQITATINATTYLVPQSLVTGSAVGAPAGAVATSGTSISSPSSPATAAPAATVTP